MSAWSHVSIITFIVLLFASGISIAGTENSNAEMKESQEITFISKALLGHAFDVQVRDDLAYACIGTTLCIFDVTDRENPEMVGYYDTNVEASHSLLGHISLQGDYAYIVSDSYNLGCSGYLYIIDVSNPSNPLEVGFYDMDYSESLDIFVEGNYAYIGNGDYGFNIVDISDIKNPVEIGTYDNLEYAQGVFIEGDYAYIADGVGGLRILDVSDKENPEEVGSLTTDYAGDVVVIDDYAYLADRQYFRIIDVSVKQSPTQVGQHFKYNARFHRVQVDGDYAYIGDASTGLRIIDISNKALPEVVSDYYSRSPYGVSVFENHVITACLEDGLHIIDVSTKDSPEMVKNIDTSDSARGIQVIEDFAFIADAKDGLHIIDITDIHQPREVGNINTPGLTDDITVVDDYAYIAEGPQGFRIIDVSDKEDPHMVAAISDIEWVWSVFVQNNYAYLAASMDGLIVVDISDKENPQEVGNCTTIDSARGVFVVDNYAYVADRDGGLRVINITVKEAPVEEGHYVLEEGWAHNVYVRDNYAYLAYAGNSVRIIDVSNKQNPIEIGVCDDNYINAIDIQLVGNYAYVAINGGGAFVIDVSNPTNPFTIDNIETGGNSWGIWADQSNIFVSDGYAGCYIFEFNQNDNPNVPPLISLISPDNNDIVSGTVIIAGETSDEDGDETIEDVEISIDKKTWEIVTGTTSWNYEWDTTEVSNGEHALRFRAYDGEDYSDIVELTLIIRNENSIPIVNFESPIDGAEVDGSITISGSATDEDGDETIEKVELSVDGEGWETASGTTSWSYDWDTTLNADGMLSIQVRAYDGIDYSDIEEISVNVANVHENIIPEVSFLTPIPNTDVSGDVYISGRASDEDGEIEKVELSVNGGSWLAVTGTETWAYSWDSKSADNGLQTITLRSYDGEDYSDVSAITITVNNEEDKDDEAWYKEPVYLGGLTAVIIVVIVVFVLFIRKRNEDYYDEWGDEEYYEEES